MQTIINLTRRISKKDNLILLATDMKQIDSKHLNTDEYKYIRSSIKENKKDFFIFNRFDHWIFVNIFRKEKNQFLTFENYRQTGAKISKVINKHKIHHVIVAGLSDNPAHLMSFAEGMALANYQFLKYKNNSPEITNSLNSIDIYSKNTENKDIDELNIRIDGTLKCRDLVNEPVAYLNAVKFSEKVEEFGKASGSRVEILNKKKIEALKMGGLLAVNKGSVDPPTFSIIEWKPENSINTKPYVLVGKGVVYDTGGMNIKTGNFMNDMKSDMAGGAAVAGVLFSLAKAKLPVYVIGLIPATDNRTDGNAYVNGDIVTMHDGSTVEVINTDAEGRMILADALSYAKKFNPKLVIDVATLTGSAARAIGKYGIVAMQSGADTEFRKLKMSGEKVNERLVEFPLWKDYEELIKSDVGDIKNLGGVEGGAITAGKFLEHFTDYPYIHLDIAGPAFAEKSYSYFSSGGTGITVRLLFDFIKSKV